MTEHARLTDEERLRAQQAATELRDQFPAQPPSISNGEAKTDNSTSGSEGLTVKLPYKQLPGGDVKDEREKPSALLADRRAEIARQLQDMGRAEAAEIIKLAFPESRVLFDPADEWNWGKGPATRRGQVCDPVEGAVPLPRAIKGAAGSQRHPYFPLEAKVLPLLPSEMDAAGLKKFYKQVALCLAPYIQELDPLNREKAEERIVEILSDIKPNGLNEIFNFIILKGMSADNLDCLGVSARRAVIKIYYMHIVPWKAFRSQRPAPTDLLKWLNQNVPDRYELRLLQGDLQNIDRAAYEKIMTWTQPGTPPRQDGVLVELPDFGLPTKTELYDPEAAKNNAPTGAQVLAAMRAGDPYGYVLNRRYDRVRKTQPVSVPSLI